MKKEGKLVWITGLAGSGKTTLAEKLREAMEYKVIHLDGDNLRGILRETTTHDIDGRIRTSKIYSELCSYLTNQGFDVIMSTISLFHSIQDYNRKNNSRYYEVFLEVDPDILINRNKKDLYKGNKKDVMGKVQEAEFPKNPTLTLFNNYPYQIDTNIQKIMKVLKDG